MREYHRKSFFSTPNRVEEGTSGYFTVTGKNSNAVYPVSVAVFYKAFSCLIDEWIAKRSKKFIFNDGFSV